MNDQKERMRQTGIRILTLSRNELYLAMRYLDTALFRLDFEMNLSTRTIGTDGARILFHPAWLADQYLADPVWVNRAYMHILMHNLFCHDFQGNGKNRESWNLACDIAAESILDSMTDRTVHVTTSDYREYVYSRLHEEMKVLNAQSIYYFLENTCISGREFERMKQEFLVDDHSFWEQHEEENDPRKQNPQNKDRKQREEEWQEIGRKLQTNLETLSSDYGDDCGDLLQSLQVSFRERYHFREFLRQFAAWGEEILPDEDSFDYIFYTWGLEHYGNMPLIEALEYKEVKKIDEFVIAIDTSASCPTEMIQKCLNETFEMLSDRESFFKKIHIHILQCDAGIQSDTVLRDRDECRGFMENFEVRGSGGTDFRPVFDYTRQLIEKGQFNNLKGLLYFTDGIGEYPGEQPPFETAFIFLGKDYLKRQVPPWAIKLILTPQDLHEDVLQEVSV